jgi:exopolysaccharide production protein ExoY
MASDRTEAYGIRGIGPKVAPPAADLGRAGRKTRPLPSLPSSTARHAGEPKSGIRDESGKSESAKTMRSPEGPVGGVRKRLLDILIASVALVLLAPVMILVVLAIKASMGGPPTFSQVRVGYGGRAFTCYKFRTMVQDAEEVLEQHLRANPGTAAQWRAHRKLRTDPRVTRLGRALRKSSLDELPQLINVLRGEMSCVGPRPVVSEELVRYGSNSKQYLLARPGMTGAWQVSGRSRLDYAQRVELDVDYVSNWTLGTDLLILAKTVLAVFRFNDAC